MFKELKTRVVRRASVIYGRILLSFDLLRRE
jgi:hypothetical protein